MKKSLFVILLLFCVGMTTLRSQSFFSTDKDTFYNQLNAFLNSSSSKEDREEAAAIMKGFEGVWKSYYSQSEADMVIRLCEQFHARSGARVYANIFNFVEVLQKIPTAGLSHQDVGNWLGYTDAKAQKSMVGMDKYLASCQRIFVDKVLSAKGNSKWMLRDALIGFPSRESFELTVDGTLVLASSKDESVINGALGVYHLEDNLWEGRGGRADWSRFGISPSEMSVQLPDYYTLDLNRSEYSIDSVIYRDNHYFKDPILCRYEDKVLVNNPDERTQYPRVRSYRSDYVIPNIFKDIDFRGGFGVMGNQIEVFGEGRRKAVFNFRKGNKRVLKVEAPRFMITKEDVLVSDHAAFRLYLTDSVTHVTDSIYHNNLGFRYDNQKRKMMIYRSLKDYGDAPFHDLYHGVDIYLEAMYWDFDGHNIDFKRMEGVNPKSEGDIVSVNYFRDDDFKMLQGMDDIHPMIRIEKFVRGFDNIERQDHFSVADLANSIHYPIEQVLSLLLRLQADGYVEYDAQAKWVTVLPRYYDVLDSYREKIDFDVIKLHTATTNRQPNLRLDLTNNEMLVFGITSQIDGVDGAAISLSDRKRVVIVPDNNRIVLGRNRDFRFSGGIIAGMFEFFTKDCLFSYEDFSIDMAKVDSLRFYARDNRHIIPVNGTLERLQGHLMIDRGDNKSSRIETPEYPYFQSEAPAYKFYRKINGGVFHPGDVDSIQSEKDLAGKFYYKLYPFTVDSLNDLSMRKVRFDGELVSGGIFPNIKQPLVVMDDYSLGFEHQIGQNETDSYPMFDGSGRFHQKVYLSENGFYGDGRLDYQTSVFDADHFVFYLDSVTAVTHRFNMVPKEDGTLFPLANADALRMKWDVKTPVLTTETIDKPICMYGNTYFTGKTSLSPEGYAADGKLRFGLTEFDSDYFAFDANTFVADSADFLLYTADTSTVAFSATNYRANVDFDSQKVQYDYLDENSSLDFPMNHFVCSLKEAEWDMASNSLHVFNPVESFGDYATATTHEELLAVHNDASKFISLVPEQDSLQFYSMSAEYDMTNYIIHAHDVKIIRVADAAVFPYEHDIDINADSKLEPVMGELLADTLNSYHLYKDAVVNIHGRNYYEASGVWDYANKEGVNIPIQVDTIVPVNGVTHGYAHIDDEEGLRLNTQYAFKGRVTLDAKQRYGYYDGVYKLVAFKEELPVLIDSLAVADTLLVGEELVEEGQSETPGLESLVPTDTLASLNHWFASATHINPDEIRIPVCMERIQKQDPRMCNGLFYELAIDGGYFASFLTPRDGRNGLDETTSADGVLWFDADSTRFMITNTDRYDTYFDLNERGVIGGHGNIGLGFDTALTQFVMHGSYTQYPNDSLVLSGTHVFNVPLFDEQALEAMTEVYANAEGESIDLFKTQFLQYYRSENSDKETEAMFKAIDLEGYPQMKDNDFYCKTIVIPDLKMVWNDKMHAFVSVGTIGLGSFGKNVVNKYVDGFVVFDRRLGNITYFFQNDMFMTYINYNCGDGQLQVHTTYGDIVQKLFDTKEKSRTVEEGGNRFQYVAVPYESMLDFLNRLRYAGLN